MYRVGEQAGGHPHLQEFGDRKVRFPLEIGLLDLTNDNAGCPVNVREKNVRIRHFRMSENVREK